MGQLAPRPSVTALCLLLALAPAAAALAVDKDRAEYVSGPLDSIPVGAEGALSISDASQLVFVAERGAGHVEIAWESVLDVEYAQTRTGLFKTRNHFLSVVYRDERGAERKLMLELGKNLILPALDACEQRTGRRVVYGEENAAEFRVKEAPLR